jgi:hypothetical protein
VFLCSMRVIADRRLRKRDLTSPHGRATKARAEFDDREGVSPMSVELRRVVIATDFSDRSMPVAQWATLHGHRVRTAVRVGALAERGTVEPATIPPRQAPAV